MKKRLKPIVCVILVIAAMIWIVDKLPFSRKIDQTVNAVVYKDGVALAETSVSMNGERTRYLFRPNSFVGTFRVPYVEETDLADLQTQIRWNQDDNLQTIHHFYKGDFSTSDQRGLAYVLLISRDMREFALMTTNQEIIATSPEAYQLYVDHISYDETGHMTVWNVEEIPELK